MVEPQFMFPVFALALLIVTWSDVAHLIVVEHAGTQALAVQSSSELADIYEAQLVRNLAAIDQTLKTIRFTFQTRPGATLAELQAQGLLPPAMFFHIAVTDATGQLFDSNGKLTTSWVANQPFFTVQQKRHTDASAPFVSAVWQASQTPTTSAPQVTFSRRLQDAHGNFAGIVMLSVDPSYFTSGYDTVKMQQGGLLILAGTDGVIRAKRVGSKTSWGGHVTKIDELLQMQGTLDTARTGDWDDGARRFSSARTLPLYGLQAIVGLDESEQMAQYRLDRQQYLQYTSTGTILLLGLTYILSRMGWQLSRSKRQALRAQNTHFAASEASMDAFITLRTERLADKRQGAITGFVVVDTTGRGADLLGTTREALLGHRIDAKSLIIASYRSFESLIAVAATGIMDEREWQHQRPDGSTVWLHRQVVRVEGGLVAIMRDITPRKLADVRRAEQNRVLEMIATSTPLTEVLTSMALLLESQIEGSICAILLREDDGLHLKVAAAPQFPDSYVKAVHGSLIGPNEGPGGRAIHSLRPFLMSEAHEDDEALQRIRTTLKACDLEAFQDCWGFPILSHDVVTHGALGALTIFVKDAHAPTDAEAESIAMARRVVSIAIERSQVEDRIRHMANHDSLTGLPNRTLLADRLNQVLLHAQRYGRSVTVIFIDLDNFKLINDSLGHHAGDELLKAVAQRMTSCVRRTDTVVRLGGDEFVIVLFDQAQDNASVAQTIEKIRQAIAEPVELSGNPYQVTCSLGLASYPADGTDAETLLTNADAAMYRAKELGRNNYQVYTPDLNVRLHDKLRLQEDLRHALARNEFRLVYQPQVDLASEHIFGVEALLRWEHPVNGLVSPAEFIPIAEESGLIISIGDWVLRTACTQNKTWQDAGLPPMTMSVNVSARQFSQPDWCSKVAQALHLSGLDAQYLELEITESVIMLDMDGAVATMRALQDMGIQMAIDDFGTGYSSLSALKHFPVTRLKIDQSFVRALSKGEDDRAIATAVISLGRQLNLRVIAEGVETQEQLAFLRDNDCNEIQGYHFSKPITPEEVENLLQTPFTWPGKIAEAVPS